MLDKILLQHGSADFFPGIAFGKPAWLLLIPPLCLAAWWIARSALGGWQGGRQWLHLALRCLVIVLLCAALAEPSSQRRSKDVAVVAVLDTSDSIPAEQSRLAEDFLAASLNRKPAADRFGLVTVAREARVQSLATALPPPPDASSSGPRDASALQRGVELARALIPEDAAGRLLLISDGNETSGNMAHAVGQLRSAGIPLDVATIDYDRSAGVRVEDVIVPAWARDGDTINARVVLNAATRIEGQLRLLLDGEPVDLDPDSPSVAAVVELEPGLQVLSQQLRLPSGPVHRIQAVFEPADRKGTVPDLLRAEAVTFTSDRGRILVLAENEEAARPWAAELASDELKIDIKPASAAPHELEAWSGYDAVVLFDQPASNFTQAQQRNLARYVHDAGGGLLVIGGPESYGAGGWIGSPLEETLPVQLDPPQKRQMPMGALALVIDCSGSMSAEVAGANMSKQAIANQAATLAVRSLSRLDQVAVVSFSEVHEVVVPLTRAMDGVAVARSIRAIGSGGGTNLFPALDAAGAELWKSPAGAKHIIILTDGETAGTLQDGIARATRLRDKGITISTVAIGDEPNSGLLQRLALAGGGRSYTVASGAMAALPQIFIKEAQTVRRALIWEGSPFSPKLAYADEAMRGIPSPLPEISGYVVTADRGGLSTISLRGPEGDPILARWQHGLGRVTAYTSDATSRWSTAWVSWGAFRSFWSQQLRWTMRPSGDALAKVAIETRGDRARVSLELLDAAGERVNFANIAGRIASPATPGGASEDSRDIRFQQVGPGRYEAEVEAATTGIHLVSARYEAPGSNGQTRSGAIRAGIVHRAGEELRRPTPDTAMLWEAARSSNGRIYRLDPAGFDLWSRDHLAMPIASRAIWMFVALAALTIFLLDVAARRIAVDLRHMSTQASKLWSTGPATTSAAAVLTAARKRAKSSTSSSAIQPEAPRAAHSDRSASDARSTGDARAASHAGSSVDPSPISDAPPTPREPQPSRSAPVPNEPDNENVMDRLRAAKNRGRNREE